MPKKSKKRKYEFCVICGSQTTGRSDSMCCSVLCRKKLAVHRASTWYLNNKEKKAGYDCLYRDRTRDRQRMASKRFRVNHPGRKNADTAKRRADTILRTPIWASLDEIRKIYENCPEGYHVDHIIPLRGKHVSGLHVETNLQYLPAIENMKKSNHYSLGEN